VTIQPLATAAAVLEAVQIGQADIGLVAPNPARLGVVRYSQPYLLVQQICLVRDHAPLRAVGELDRPGSRLGANTGDSVALYLKTHFGQATVLESPDYTLKEGATWLAEGTVDAFAGNR
jgi:polar amino acid transport system substrate-binding protein